MIMKKLLLFVSCFLLLVTPVLATHKGFIHAEEQCVDPNGKYVGKCDLDAGYTCKVKINPNFLKAGFCKLITSTEGVAVPGGNPTSETNFTEIFGKIQAPSQLSGLGIGSAGLSSFLSRILTILYSVAAVAFVFMVVYSAVQLILSGGDKEKIGQARSRLTYAIIGLILLALAFVIIRVIGTLTGFSLFREGILSPPAAVQYLSPGQTCQTGTTTLGQCDNLSGLYCRASGQGEVYICQTVTK